MFRLFWLQVSFFSDECDVIFWRVLTSYAPKTRPAKNRNLNSTFKIRYRLKPITASSHFLSLFSSFPSAIIEKDLLNGRLPKGRIWMHPQRYANPRLYPYSKFYTRTLLYRAGTQAGEADLCVGKHKIYLQIAASCGHAAVAVGVLHEIRQLKQALR